MRLDKWLWSVRVYKSRALATAAINGGHVRVNGEPVKPARDARPGDLVTSRIEIVLRTLRVLGAPPSRIGAKLVAEFAEELTSPEELAKRRVPNLLPPGIRPPGAGRPTKRERREMDELRTQREGENPDACKDSPAEEMSGGHGP